MPLCYGGGINNAQEAKRIFSLGIEKVAISSSAIKDPILITKIAESVGSQSVVVVIDVKKKYLRVKLSETSKMILLLLIKLSKSTE